jgi:CheY-like chemotaxis protein
VTPPVPLAGKRLLLLSEDAALASLVAGALSAEGIEVVPAGTGAAALAALESAGPLDVAVLDLPVSDAAAGALLGPLAARHVPAVVVSGVFRGPRAEAALRRLEARDLLEKPFSLPALVGTVAAALGAAPAPPPGEVPDEVTSAPPLGAAPAPALEPPPENAPPSPVEGLAAPLPATPGGRPRPRPPAPPPSGALAETPLPRVLAALHVGQATGALTLSRGPERKILAFEQGAPVYAASNLAEERFDALCLRCELVTPERLDALRAAAPGRRTADLLVDAELLDPARRAELLAGQIRAIVWSAFPWREGEYRFQTGRPPAGRVPLRLDPGDLILEGMRRTGELERLRAELPEAAHLAPTPDPAFELYALRLTGEEARLLTLADGTKSVGDLLRLSDLDARATLAFLQGCRHLRVLDEVDRVLASTRRMGFM